MNNSSIVTLSDASFEETVLKSKLPVLVDFWAEWCVPCKGLTPILEEFAAENLEKIKVCKLNVDENTATATQYGIRSIPTLILFKDGKAQINKSGALTKSQLKEIFLKS